MEWAMRKWYGNLGSACRIEVMKNFIFVREKNNETTTRPTTHGRVSDDMIKCLWIFVGVCSTVIITCC